jgi:hypothetical protein
LPTAVTPSEPVNDQPQSLTTQAAPLNRPTAHPGIR